MNQSPLTIEQALGRFGLTSFRPGQRDVIQSIVSGNDCLCVMPTGGGKSLCFQLPSLIRSGLTIVVSPLIALMKDQVDALSRNGIPAALINSTLSQSEQRDRLHAVASGKYQLVYVAPERLRNQRFLEAIRATPIQLLAVDEAHCISQWGHDFRPDYARIGEFRQWLGGVQTVALTATATPRVRNDIVEVLNLRKAKQFMSGFARPNLHFGVVTCPSENEKNDELQDFLYRTKGAGIIYAATRKRCETLVELLREKLKITAGAYHAGLLPEQRRIIQERFMSGQLNLIVATNAFGMGIDKPDLRFVLHYNIPGSLEAYYQEAGRAGRDGKQSVCVLLYSYSDKYIQEFFIENNYPPRELIQEVYEFLQAREEDPIELTLDEIKEEMGVRVSAEAIGSCLQILARTRVLERLEMGAGLAMVRINSNLPTLVELLPRDANVRRSVLRVLERAVGDRRYEEVYLHPNYLIEQSGLERESLLRHLREISKLNDIDYVPPFRGRAVHFKRNDVPFDQLEIDFENLRKRKEAEVERLNQVIHYAQSPLCRQVTIMNYFGDPQANRCEHCDRCERSVGWPKLSLFGDSTANAEQTRLAESPISAQKKSQLSADHQIAFLRRVIDAIERTHGRIGKILIAQYLSGSSNAKVQQLGLHRMGGFGLLKGFKQADAIGLLDLLIGSGLLRQQEATRNRPTVSLSPNLVDTNVRDELFASLVFPAGLAKLIEPLAAVKPAEDARGVETSNRAFERTLTNEVVTAPARTAAPLVAHAPLEPLVPPQTQRETAVAPRAAKPDWQWSLELFQADYDWQSVLAIRRMTDDQLGISLCEAIRNGASLEKNWLSSAGDEARTPGQQRVLRELQRRASAGV